MSTEPSLPGAADALFGRLFDDASLFPPGDLPMRAAVAGHQRHGSAWYRDLTGPFVCPQTRLGELGAALTAANIPEIDLALVVTGGAAAVAAATDSVAADPRLRLRAIEVPASPASGAGHSARDVAAALDGALLAGAACYIEIPAGFLTDQAAADAVLALIDGRGYRVKLRTGGLTAAAFPDESTLAACLTAVTTRRVPFKCTAGLHHAVRHTADTGTKLEQHGFLNVLLAVGAAVAGADPRHVAAALAQRDPAVVVEQILALDADTTAEIRSMFTSFGTCSTDEPIADLTSLGVLSQP
jgi:hypothetical protein